MHINLLFGENIVLFYNNNVYYKFGIYTNDLYILDLEMSILIIHNKKNTLDNQYPIYLWK